MAGADATARRRTTAGGRPAVARRLSDVAVAVPTVLVLALSVGACTGGGADGSPTAEPRSELDAYLDEIYVSVDAETWVTDHDATQEYLAACMAEQGFEYHPTTAPPMYSMPAELTPAYAAEFGYGDTTEAYGPDVPPMRFSAMPGDDPASDFNQSYVLGLAADAQEEYWLAMHGPDVPPDEDPAAIPLEEAGCYARAYAQLYPESRRPAEFAPLEEAIREEIWWVDEDPRLTATHPAWAECMADAGYPGLVDIPDAAALANDNANSSALSLAIPYAELKEMFPDELAQVQQFEIDVAVADTGCREEVGWYDVRADVLAEAEASIVERYRAELDAMLEWVRSQRAGLR
jgi:hypothetical protein